jgi:hypothetical protein
VDLTNQFMSNSPNDDCKIGRRRNVRDILVEQYTVRAIGWSGDVAGHPLGRDLKVKA